MADSGTRTYKAPSATSTPGGRQGRGQRRDEGSAGRQGAGLAEMTNAGLPTPPGFTIHHRSLQRTTSPGQEAPGRPLGRRPSRRSRSSSSNRQGPRRSGEPASGVRPLRRQVQYAGHDGHRPQPRPQRGVPSGPHRDHRQRALRLGRLPSLHQHVRPDRARCPDPLAQEQGRLARRIQPLRRGPRRRQGSPRQGRQGHDLDVADLKALVATYKKIVRDTIGRDFPDDPNEQLDLAIKAVFASWFGKRANDYRNSQKIPHDLGTAVNVGDHGSLATWATTPARRRVHPRPQHRREVSTASTWSTPRARTSWRHSAPRRRFAALAQGHAQGLRRVQDDRRQAREALQDVQDLEFTIERGRLYMLQTRSAKRTAAAAMRIAIDHGQGEPHHAGGGGRARGSLPGDIRRGYSVGRLENTTALTIGLAASPGVAWGEIVHLPGRREKEAGAGKLVILTRPETCPTTSTGWPWPQGILTSTGGTTSHAAVVARELGSRP